MKGNSVLRRTPLIPTLRRLGIPPTRFLLTVDLSSQTMCAWESEPARELPILNYGLMERYRISSSKFGIGQTVNSNCTPLGLHRIAQKVGGGYPPGTVFRGRKPVGFTWQGLPGATIVHRIFWLEGLEPGFNRGGEVDSFERYIYIHGFADEASLGHPASHGCIHLAGGDLIPLYDWLPAGTLVWIDER
jgi:L,D-transpeptidase catalytic domain